MTLIKCFVVVLGEPVAEEVFMSSFGHVVQVGPDGDGVLTATHSEEPQKSLKRGTGTSSKGCVQHPSPDGPLPALLPLPHRAVPTQPAAAARPGEELPLRAGDGRCPAHPAPLGKGCQQPEAQEDQLRSSPSRRVKWWGRLCAATEPSCVVCWVADQPEEQPVPFTRPSKATFLWTHLPSVLSPFEGSHLRHRDFVQWRLMRAESSFCHVFSLLHNGLNQENWGGSSWDQDCKVYKTKHENEVFALEPPQAQRTVTLQSIGVCKAQDSALQPGRISHTAPGSASVWLGTPPALLVHLLRAQD
ncbi:uncharacterized protein LOC131580639 [Poecile atricapillus]|uniref:uncharacterized protein LOC131580639 n=1 Tax=Poecile atricapillus TaxID=48891 RepID=UPI002739B858|nr:uncharacterized protein LOC131580639 [Poecile atricapillus]